MASATTTTTTTGSKCSAGTRSTSGTRSAAVDRPFSVRGFTSILLVLCLLMMIASGLTLYLAPRGRIANSTAWTALALSRQQWSAVHINASLLFAAVTSAHLVLNGSRLVGYLKKRARPGINMQRELASAIALACVIFAATVLGLPPINLPIELKFKLRDAWEQRVERNVTPHAGAIVQPPRPALSDSD